MVKTPIKPLGDEREHVDIEPWMVGRTVVAVSTFVDGEGQRWRQITLDDGHVVQMIDNAPWLVLAPDP